MLKPSLALVFTVLCVAGCGDGEPQAEPPATNQPATEVRTVDEPPTEEPPIQDQDSSGDEEESRPTEGDSLVLDALRNAGADLSKPTEVIWFVYFPAEEAARTFAERAASGGWETAIDRGADEESWLCKCTRQAVPSLHAIGAMRVRFEAWSQGLDAEIDGWEASVTK